MRKFLLAAAATIAVASPAVARDGSGYVGVDAGALFPLQRHVDGTINFTNAANTDITITRFGRIKYKTGYDVDLNAGYDFGMFRVEGELGYKHAKHDPFFSSTQFIDAINGQSGSTLVANDLDPTHHVNVLSGMINGLIDIGEDNSINGFLGGGIGVAKVKELGDSNSGLAWQILAGVRTPISDNIDLGLKYRYFRTRSHNFNSAIAFSAVGTTCGALPCSGGTVLVSSNERFESHSVLLSLTYNFAAAAPPPPPPPQPPPPPPPPPATQTCPDGSVILATATCPAPPPPPPPPPPPVEKGERGE